MWIEIGKFVIAAGLGFGGTFCYILMIDRKRKREQEHYKQQALWDDYVNRKRAKEKD